MRLLPGFEKIVVRKPKDEGERKVGSLYAPANSPGESIYEVIAVGLGKLADLPPRFEGAEPERSLPFCKVGDLVLLLYTDYSMLVDGETQYIVGWDQVLAVVQDR